MGADLRGERRLVVIGERARRDLARLDVRLIERIDAEDGARDGRRDLPAKELGAELVGVVDAEPYDRLTGALERRHRVVLRRIGGRGQTDVDELAIVAVHGGRTERLA